MAWFDLLRGIPHLGIFEGFDPREPSPGLRPHVYKPGIYRLYRKAFEDTLTFVDPSGDSYELQPFDCESILRIVVHMKEMEAQKLLDLVWNFRAVEWNTETRFMKSIEVPPDDIDSIASFARPPKRTFV